MSVLRTQLAGAARRPARLVLTGLAVLVASFVVYATVLAQQIAESSVIANLSGTPQGVDLVVDGSLLTTAQLDKIRSVPGVDEAVGRAEAGGDVGGQYLTLIADPGQGPLAVTRLAQGRLPSGPHEIAVNARTAERMAISVGTVISMSTGWDEAGTPARPARLTVTGTVGARDEPDATGYAPQATVSALRGDKDLDRIDVRLADGVEPDVARAGVRAVVAAMPPTPADENPPTVHTGNEVRAAEANEAAEQVAAVFAVVAMFVSVAVVAAGLVATFTFRIVFAQRMRQLALLRAVGAGRGAISRALTTEGALTGLVAGLTGVLGALTVGQLLPPLLRAFGVAIDNPGFPLGAAVKVVALAVIGTVLAALAPAASVARVSPLEALRTASTTGGRCGIGRLRWVLGVVLVVAAAALAVLVPVSIPGRSSDGVPMDFDMQPMLLMVVVSGACVFLALIALGPVLVRPLLAVLGWPLRRLGTLGRLAAGGIGGAPRRAAAVSVVVALGSTLIVGVLVGGASARAVADRQAALTAPADFELTAGDATIDEAMVARARASTELTHVTPYRRLDELTVDGTEMQAVACDLPITGLPRLGKLDIAAGTLNAVHRGEAVVSGAVAEITGVRLGDRTTISLGKRNVTLTVTGVLRDSAPLHGNLILAPDDLTRLGAPATYSGLLADAATAGEHGRTAARQAVEQVTGGRPGFGITVLADTRDQIDRSLTAVLAIALGLVALTVLIAVVGVGTTTALSVVERVHESGLLRAVGLSRSGLRIMLTMESALYGVIGAGLGLTLGVPYAWLVVTALRIFAPFTMPVGQLTLVFAALVLLTTLAGILPARRAARVSPVAALAGD